MLLDQDWIFIEEMQQHFLRIYCITRFKTFTNHTYHILRCSCLFFVYRELKNDATHVAISKSKPTDSVTQNM